jgi:predicted O-methyltransferase YrrM
VTSTLGTDVESPLRCRCAAAPNRAHHDNGTAPAGVPGASTARSPAGRRRGGTVAPSTQPAAPTQEAVIVTPPKPASWSFSEEYVAEDSVLAGARARAEEVGVVPIGPGAGAALRFLASVLDARAVVEIGSGTGVSGLWMLRGMRPDGVLTSVDTEAEHQRLAKETFAEAGIPSQRVRLIPGAGLEVLPRLTDGHYDLVCADGDKQEYPEYLTEALRLLRPGGVVAFDNALWHDRVADPAQRDPETIAIREVGRIIREDETLVPVLLPVGDGLLLAKKVWVPEG